MTLPTTTADGTYGSIQFRRARQRHQSPTRSRRCSKAMRQYTELLHIGPWFLVGPFVPPKGLYRGVTTKIRVSLALAFAGETNIELIQQHDEEPSVFRETLKARGAHGFHHWAVGARDFEKSVAHYRSLGYAEAFSDTAPMGFRVVHFDTTRDLPGMLE